MYGGINSGEVSFSSEWMFWLTEVTASRQPRHSHPHAQPTTDDKTQTNATADARDGPFERERGHWMACATRVAETIGIHTKLMIS